MRTKATPQPWRWVALFTSTHNLSLEEYPQSRASSVFIQFFCCPGGSGPVYRGLCIGLEVVSAIPTLKKKHTVELLASLGLAAFCKYALLSRHYPDLQFVQPDVSVSGWRIGSGHMPSQPIANRLGSHPPTLEVREPFYRAGDGGVNRQLQVSVCGDSSDMSDIIVPKINQGMTELRSQRRMSVQKAVSQPGCSRIGQRPLFF